MLGVVMEELFLQTPTIPARARGGIFSPVRETERMVGPAGHSASTEPTAPFFFKSFPNWIATFNLTLSIPCTVAVGGVL